MCVCVSRTISHLVRGRSLSHSITQDGFDRYESRGFHQHTHTHTQWNNIHAHHHAHPHWYTHTDPSAVIYVPITAVVYVCEQFWLMNRMNWKSFLWISWFKWTDSKKPIWIKRFTKWIIGGSNTLGEHVWLLLESSTMWHTNCDAAACWENRLEKMSSYVITNQPATITQTKNAITAQSTIETLTLAWCLLCHFTCVCFEQILTFPTWQTCLMYRSN